MQKMKNDTLGENADTNVKNGLKGPEEAGNPVRIYMKKSISWSYTTGALIT